MRSPVRDGLAGEDDPPAGAQHAVELAEGRLEVGQVVQHRVAEDEVEGAVLEGQLGRVDRRGLHVEAEACGVALEHAQHPRRDVGAGRALHAAVEQEVEREVAGAGADLERVAVARRVRAERLAQLAHDLLDPDRAELDPPLGVVRRGGVVVVAGVDVEDLLDGCRRRHSGGECKAPPRAGAFSRFDF
jgi:hypothetical protein